MPNVFQSYIGGVQAGQEENFNRNRLAMLNEQNSPQALARRNKLADIEVQSAQQGLDASKAKEGYTRLAQALNSPNPKAFVMQYEPDLARNLQQSAGVDLSTMDDEDAHTVLKALASHLAGAAGIAPTPQMQDIQGADGSVLQRDPTSNALKQVVAPQKPDHFLEAEAGRNKRSAASIAARPAAHPTSQQGTPDNIEKAAQAISNYQQAPLGAFAMRSPYGQSVMARVMELNPDYQANEFSSRSKAYKDFSSGKNGNQVRSFNVAISHLASIEQMADALDNGDVPALNKLKNAFARQTGKAAPNTFDGMKKIVTDEIVKSIVGAGGGVADREEASNTIASASSPAQLIGILNGYRELMAGQLHGLQQQYEQSTGRKDFDRFLSGESKQYLQQHQGSDTAPPASTPQTAQPVRVRSIQEARALPPGTVFVTPDGQLKKR